MSIIKEAGTHALASEFNFNPTVEWAYTNGITIATLMPGQRRKQVERATSACNAGFLASQPAFVSLKSIISCLVFASSN